ncbi:asparagine synthase (glutamine-hydrolyzing) [Paludibacter jiangxiensis]|uniref:asparagine synthase (glutamine-hydrolyzing) n=1 Tax=Paludibacter jiangxiensis TaxID=681398 RepID=A0A170ZNU8_9BACT|nr:asparagine synthase (glutamine-hydrolyzing) [Paludibacter jiangxiensis]GAT62868.1 asparagine synthase [Paludibacter jiangxiensis]
MCGISAIYRYTRISDDDRQRLTQMNREMHYRGPDENDVWSDDTCGLAHTRLSIIGLENGRQPLFSKDKSLVLICNGEIYNYIELKKELEAKGHHFSSDSDSETILHLYEEYGVKCLEHLRGMFAFCLWNTTTKQLFAARDRIGEKTLYYSQLPCGVVFSTELKAILHQYIEKPQIDLQQLAISIRYNYPFDKKNTYVNSIKRIEPGEYILVDQSGMRFHTYWKPFARPTFNGTFEQAKTETLRLMQESVNLCLRSDVPIGVLLSGGIDSSAIAALAKESGREVHVVTAGYKGNYDCDERAIAKRFAKEKGLIYHEIELDARDFKDLFWEYSQYIDEPICDVSSMSQWALYKKAKEMGFTVLLGGLGGDELFYGYPSTNALAESLKLSHEHQALFPFKGTERKIRFLRFLATNWRHILFAGYSLGYTPKSVVHWTYEDYKKFAETASFTLDDDRYNFKDADVYIPLEKPGNEIEQMNYFEFSYFMTMLCLYLADRQGMGNSVEIRSPLIDYKLVEFVFSLPVEMKYRRGNPKYFLKETLKELVPNYILNGAKRGFTPPQDFIHELIQDYQYRVLSSEHRFFNSILADRLLDLQINRYENR